MATKRKDGRLQSSVTVTDYFTGEKKKIYIYGYTEKELEAEKKRVKEEAEKATLSRCEPSFAEWSIECLEMKLANKDINEVTFESYETKLNRNILPNIPKGIKVKDIQAHHVKYVLANTNGGRTKEYVYTIMNIVMKEALFAGMITQNPCSFVRKPKHKSEHFKVMEFDQYQQIINDVKGTQWEHLFMFAIHTGCRRSELAGLRWCDVDLDEGKVNIRTAMKETKREGVHHGTTKTKYSIRTLFLSEGVIESLRAWERTLRAALIEQRLPWFEDSTVFRRVTDISKPMRPEAITSKMGWLRKKYDIPVGVCTHSYRHTYATNLAEQDLQLKKIQLTIGHASAAFTADTYIHSTPDMFAGVKEANDAIAKKYKAVK